MYREWLVDAMAKTRRSQADIVRATGISASVINRMVLGTRAIRDFEIVQLSKALGVLPPVAPKNGEAQSPGNQTKPIAMDIVPVIAVIQDGSWREKGAGVIKPSVNELPLPSGSDYAGMREAVQIACPPGMENHIARQYALFVPTARLPRNLRDGNQVYAEIFRAGFVQTTLLHVIAPSGDITGFRQETAAKTWRSDQVNVLGFVAGMLIEYR